MKNIIIIGAGLAGLSAAIETAKKGMGSILVSDQPTERAQSVLAQGGINAASYIEGDSIQSHYEDTLAGGAYLADPEAIQGLVAAAPQIVEELAGLGVPFHRENGRIARRSLGGQKKKRAAYAKKSTGKTLVTALVDEVRKYEASGLVGRMPHHQFTKLYLEAGKCKGCFIRDTYTDETVFLEGPVLLACGGLNGMFGEHTTGSRSNTGAAATVFRQGVELGNLEFVQYHPTTFSIPGKRCLASEAARGEGGRLFVRRMGIPWYFMKEKYPELGNLMPRDIVSREMAAVCERDDCGHQVYLDMTGVSTKVWRKGLADLKEECVKYLHIDPEKEPVPVEPAVHYFMGGILADKSHRTNIRYVYAAGECACQYHGANRLGGNSMLGAIYGGKIAAQSAVGDLAEWQGLKSIPAIPEWEEDRTDMKMVSGCLAEGMGIVRSGEKISRAARKLEELWDRAENGGKRENRLLLGLAMLRSADERKESRGAHFRSDYPESDEGYRKTTVAVFDGERIRISFQDIAGKKSDE